MSRPRNTRRPGPVNFRHGIRPNPAWRHIQTAERVIVVVACDDCAYTRTIDTARHKEVSASAVREASVAHAKTHRHNLVMTVTRTRRWYGRTWVPNTLPALPAEVLTAEQPRRSGLSAVQRSTLARIRKEDPRLVRLGAGKWTTPDEAETGRPAWHVTWLTVGALLTRGVLTPTKWQKHPKSQQEYIVEVRLV